jgi:hypothetical protein
MRDYGVVSPKFWIGETGKALRGNAPAQVLALYLMTCPHANMIGVFHCPVLYMAHETGLGMEGASKALQSLIEAGYCTYDEASETVFVHRMAAYQVAESLKPGDNRVKGVEREWSNIGPAHLKSAFAAIYSVAFHLPVEEAKESPLKAPSKPLGSQEQEHDHEQDHDQEQEKSAGEPATSPVPEKQKSRTVTLAAYLDTCKALGVKAIPNDHHIRRYCADAGITDEMTAIAWLRFREEHTTGARKAKKYIDWPETFANCVKSSWYGLWACNAEGPANWTTKGLQEKRVADARRAEKEAANEHA